MLYLLENGNIMNLNTGAWICYGCSEERYINTGVTDKDYEGIKKLCKNYTAPNSTTMVHKRKIGEHVLLSSEEQDKLVGDFGVEATNEMIERLNDYIGSTGKKYKSHYHTIRQWFARRQEDKKKNLSKDVYVAEKIQEKMDSQNTLSQLQNFNK